MYKDFIAIIPARSGSTRLKDKNISKLNGRPLYTYSTNQAIKLFEKSIISTNFSLILESFFDDRITIDERPAELCLNTTPMSEVISYLIHKYQLQGKNIVLLQPTSPLRSDVDVINAVEQFSSTKCSMLMTVSEISSSILKCGFIDNGTFVSLSNRTEDIFSNDQALRTIYKPNGAIYIFNADDFIKSNNNFPSQNIYCISMPKNRSIDINTEEDLIKAQKEIFDIIGRSKY